jgi:hypothetical protein
MSTTKIKEVQINEVQTMKEIQIARGIDGWFKNQVAKFERSRLGWMAMYITAQSALGSIACMYLLQNNASDIMLITCAIVTMACNSVFIAQGPGKWCLPLFYISIFLNSIFILLNASF